MIIKVPTLPKGRFLFSLLIITALQRISANAESIGSVDWTYDDLRNQLEEFATLYQRRPIRDNAGGMNSAHMFHVWFLTKQLNPTHIIESGIWKGQSTWLFEQAAPHAKLTAIDPKLKIRKYISRRVTYSTTDFSKYDWSHVTKESTLCFFDDHQGAHRIKECHEQGFKHILYEDNYPGPGGNFDKNALSVKATLKAGGPDAYHLRSIIKTYYEFPPIFMPKFHNKPWKKMSAYTNPPLLTQATEPHHALYNRQADGYRWIAYIELR